MQGPVELETIYLIVVFAVFLIAWFVPTTVVHRCRRRVDTIDEKSICPQIAQFSKHHPIILTIIVTSPALLWLGAFSSFFNGAFDYIFYAFCGFTIFYIIIAWRNKDFPP